MVSVQGELPSGQTRGLETSTGGAAELAPPERAGLIAGASAVAAIIASSCCVVPLVLVLLGISGAWVGTLTALEPYKFYFIATTVGLIGLGYWHVYSKPKADCDVGSYCANPASGRITKVTLWAATAVVLVAATVDLWAPLFY